MDAAELRLIELIGLPDGAVKRDFITIEMDEKPFKVRTFVAGDDSDGRQTLLLVHGYMASGLAHFNIIKPLTEKYRVVFFDNFGWGMNTKLQECPRGMESAEAADAWMTEWILKTFDALDLPD